MFASLDGEAGARLGSGSLAGVVMFDADPQPVKILFVTACLYVAPVGTRAMPPSEALLGSIGIPYNSVQ
jgi:hypothetical protein